MSAYDEIRRRLTRREASFEPCLPRPAKEPPVGPEWIHEIKHDGFRILLRRQGPRVRLVSRNARDLTYRFPTIASAVATLPIASCLIDGEAIVCDDNGLSVFDLIRNHRHGGAAMLCAFDVLELNGQDLRDRPLEERKAALEMLLRPSHPGIAYNRHFDVEGWIVFHQACKLGCEGIVSKRLGSLYRSGRSSDWIKVKNPATPAVKREAERTGAPWANGRADAPPLLAAVARRREKPRVNSPRRGVLMPKIEPIDASDARTWRLAPPST
jgi:bifunctional non-homologous end joining protein LigD